MVDWKVAWMAERKEGAMAGKKVDGMAGPMEDGMAEKTVYGRVLRRAQKTGQSTAARLAGKWGK